MIKRITLVLFFVLVAPVTACIPPTTPIDSRLVTANTSFGFHLFDEILKRDSDKNVVVSPVGVAMALEMAYNGAANETQLAMEQVLELEELSLPEMNQANAALLNSLKNPDPKVELAIANSLWARKGVSFKSDFMKHNRQFFGAEIAEIDFDDPKASEIINHWVETSTDGRIEEIVGKKIDPLTMLFLINAIYFKGQWASEFDESNTRDGIFHLPDGGQKQIPMMSQSGTFSHYRGSHFQAIILPYGKGRINMVIFLPDRDSSLNEFLENLTAENWTGWMSEFREWEGDLFLPRFKFEYEISLNDALKAIGMEIAFDEIDADFGGMRPIPPNIFISDVKHKTFIEVNEQGTEAAAVSKVEFEFQSAKPEFVVDRPFFFTIHDNQTGAILFMGTVIEP
jgi:serine protease inhibitor